MKIKTQFEFDAAHRLVGYNGKCSNIHGHIWKVEIELFNNNYTLDDVGILWDFTNTKIIKDKFDHKTILKSCKENAIIINAIEKTCGFDSIYLMGENPTAENLCWEILRLVSETVKDCNIRIRVYESPKSYAEEEIIPEKNA